MGGGSGAVVELDWAGHELWRYEDPARRTAVLEAVLDRLRALPGVTSVDELPTYKVENVHGVPYIGGPLAWGDYGYTGAGVKIGIIDTGIDYYHANFGGSGDPAWCVSWRPPPRSSGSAWACSGWPNTCTVTGCTAASPHRSRP